MNGKIRLFDETLKVLVATAATSWLLYVVSIVFISENDVCTSDSLYNAVALITGLLTALPFVYGLVKLLVWPNGQKSVFNKFAGWIVSCGVGIFIVAVTLFALAISQYGCQ